MATRFHKEALKSRKALWLYGLVALLNSPTWQLIGFLGDIDFIINVINGTSGVVLYVRDWGWIIAVIWILYLGFSWKPSQRVQDLQSIFTEAASYMKKIASEPELNVAVKSAWDVHNTIPVLIRQSLKPRESTAELLKYKKLLADNPCKEYEVSAEFLRSLAEEIGDDAVDPTFLMPHTFAQFIRTEQWPPNVSIAES